MNEYLTAVLDQVNRPSKVADTPVSGDIKRYRHLLQTLREKVTINPAHRFSENEIFICGWALQTFSTLKPPPLLVALLRDRVLRGNTPHFSVPESTDIRSCEKYETEDSHLYKVNKVTGLADKVIEMIPSKYNRNLSISGERRYSTTNRGRS
jgi:hypothetical protein